MDARIIAVLLYLIQSYVSRQMQPDPGNNLARLGVGGMLGALAVRPVRLVLGPARLVGRGVGWVFGWNNPRIPLAHEPPQVPLFRMYEKESLREVIGLVNGQQANRLNIGDSDLVCFATNAKVVKVVIQVVSVVAIFGVIYVLFKIFIYVYFRALKTFKSEESEFDRAETKRLEARLQKLSEERARLEKSKY